MPPLTATLVCSQFFKAFSKNGSGTALPGGCSDCCVGIASISFSSSAFPGFLRGEEGSPSGLFGFPHVSPQRAWQASQESPFEQPFKCPIQSPRFEGGAPHPQKSCYVKMRLISKNKPTASSEGYFSALRVLDPWLSAVMGWELSRRTPASEPLFQEEE